MKTEGQRGSRPQWADPRPSSANRGRHLLCGGWCPRPRRSAAVERFSWGSPRALWSVSAGREHEFSLEVGSAEAASPPRRGAGRAWKGGRAGSGASRAPRPPPPPGRRRCRPDAAVRPWAAHCAAAVAGSEVSRGFPPVRACLGRSRSRFAPGPGCGGVCGVCGCRPGGAGIPGPGPGGPGGPRPHPPGLLGPSSPAPSRPARPRPAPCPGEAAAERPRAAPSSVVRAARTLAACKADVFGARGPFLDALSGFSRVFQGRLLTRPGSVKGALQHVYTPRRPKHRHQMPLLGRLVFVGLGAFIFFCLVKIRGVKTQKHC